MLEEGKRLHGLDVLRAVAMLLGVLLHATIAYRVENAPYWIHDNEYNNIVFDFVYFFIHSFRMPLFYLIAGFFCRFLYYKRSEKEFIKNRWTRVGIPFFVGMVTIVPLTMFPFRLYQNVFTHNLSWDEAYRKSFFQMFGRNGVAHLWFLYDLLIYYTTMLIVKKIAKRYNKINYVFTKLSNWWQTREFNHLSWIFLFAGGVFIILIKEPRLFVLADTHLIPSNIFYLLFYGYFFTIGWFVYKRQDIISTIVKNYLRLIMPGILLCIILFYVESKHLLHSNLFIFYSGKYLGALLIVLFTLGLIGAALRFFKEQSNIWKYLSDASYWIYLTHMGIVMALQLYFLNSSVPGEWRFILTLVISLLISFITYQLFVRYTIIGTVLHGSRKKK